MTDTKEKTRRPRTTSGEMFTLAKIAELLEELEKTDGEAAVTRVLRYHAERCGFELNAGAGDE